MFLYAHVALSVALSVALNFILTVFHPATTPFSFSTGHPNLTFPSLTSGYKNSPLSGAITDLSDHPILSVKSSLISHQSSLFLDLSPLFRFPHKPSIIPIFNFLLLLQLFLLPHKPSHKDFIKRIKAKLKTMYILFFFLSSSQPLKPLVFTSSSLVFQSTSFKYNSFYPLYNRARPYCVNYTKFDFLYLQAILFLPILLFPETNDGLLRSVVAL